MEWGIFVVGMALVLMVGLIFESVDGRDGNATTTIPDYDPEYESLAINVADYQYAV